MEFFTYESPPISITCRLSTQQNFDHGDHQQGMRGIPIKPFHFVHSGILCWRYANKRVVEMFSLAPWNTITWFRCPLNFSIFFSVEMHWIRELPRITKGDPMWWLTSYFTTHLVHRMGQLISKYCGTFLFWTLLASFICLHVAGLLVMISFTFSLF